MMRSELTIDTVWSESAARSNSSDSIRELEHAPAALRRELAFGQAGQAVCGGLLDMTAVDVALKHTLALP